MKNLLNTIKIIGIAAVFAVAVSYVSAFTQPTVAPGSSASNVPAPIHTGASIQEKKGGIWSKNLLAAPLSIFKTNVYLPGKDSALRIGSNLTTAGTQEFDGGTATLPLNTALFGENNTIPLTIDLQSRLKPQDGIEFITNASCPVVTRWTNDKAAAFEFEKTDGSKVNIIARQVRLTGSSPDANDILVGDQYGYTRWAKATVVNGAVVFDTQPTASPVPAGQCISVIDPPLPPVDVCTNITGDQSTVPTGYHLEPAGSTTCKADVVCPTNQYMSGGVCMCSSTDMSPEDSNPLNGIGDPLFDYFEFDANSCPIPKYKIKTTVCESALAGVAWSGIPGCHQEVEPLTPPFVLLKASGVDALQYGTAADAGARSTECVEKSLSYYISHKSSYPFGPHTGQYRILGPGGDSCSDWVNTGEYLQETRREIVPI